MNLSPYCGSLSGIRKNWIILSLGLEPWPHCRYKMWKPLCHCHRLLWTPFLLSLTLRDGTVHYTLRRCWGSNPGLQGTTHCLTGWTDAWKTTWPRNRKTIFQKVTIFSESNFFFSCYDEDLQLALKVRSFVRWSEMFRLFFVLSPSDLGFPANFRTAIFLKRELNEKLG